MKILFVINRFGGGGRERRLAQLICGLEAIGGYEMYALTFFPEISYKEINQTSLKITVMNSKSRWNQINILYNTIKNIKPAFIHNWIETPTECVFLPIFAKKVRAKYIAGFVADANLEKNRIKRICISFTFYMADAIVSNSQAGLIAKNAPSNKSNVIYNGFDYKRVPQEPVSKIKESFGITQKYIVCMCARINKAKDWDSFLALAKKSWENNLDIFFLAVGSGNQLEYYREKIHKTNYKNIQFIGYRNDVESIILMSNVCCLFSHKGNHLEGISNFIMESMAIGKPIIATSGGGTSEIIDNGINSYTVEPGNVSAAYNKLLTLLQNDRVYNEISTAAKKKIKDKFLLSNMARQYDNLYKKLVIK